MTVGNEWWRPMPHGASSDAMRILLLIKFQKVRPPEEAGVAAG